MSLQISFNNTVINEEYYRGLSQNYEIFGDNFKLGATPINTFTISIAKEGVRTQPTEVQIAYNNIYYAYLKVDNIEEKEYEYVYTLSDRMADLEFNYDASQIFVDGKTTLLAIVQDICSKVGLVLDTTEFRGYNKEISWYDNTKTARQYIGYVAELNGGFARIARNRLYFVKQKTYPRKTINFNECEEFNIGERHLITRVVYELGAVKWEYGTNTGNTLYLNSDNVFITEQSEVQAIYSEILNFEFYSVDIKNAPIDYTISVGSIVTFTDGTNNYPTIVQYDLEYFGDWIGGYNLDVKTERQEETQIIPTAEHIKNLQITVNRQEGEIESKVQKDEVISTINQSAEQVTINADKISLAGKTIDLSTDQINITSNNMQIDEDGKITSTGEIDSSGTGGAVLMKLQSTDHLHENLLRPHSITFVNSATRNELYLLNTANGVWCQLNSGNSGIILYNNENYGITRIRLYNSIQETQINPDGITTPTLTQTSREESKKNFEKLENALDIIKNTDIYKYNLKNEKDETKKHIGFVIGNNYKYSHEITAENEKKEEVGVDTYSMISVAYKAIQEQQEMIEQLHKEIEQFKNK